MSAENVPAPWIDFSLSGDNQKRRKILYFKRPKGTKIPVGLQWRCICGTINTMNEREEQYCTMCGSSVRHQENLNPAHTYYTCVVVHHLPPRR